MGVSPYNPQDQDHSYDRGIGSRSKGILKDPSEPSAFRSVDLLMSHMTGFSPLLAAFSLSNDLSFMSHHSIGQYITEDISLSPEPSIQWRVMLVETHDQSVTGPR